MTLKNAAAVCLISLFSATLVVLIARELDLQTGSQLASRLEPQLKSLVEEIRAARRQGVLLPPPGGAAAPAASASDAASDGLVVYFFHGDARCENCRTIESQSRRLVEGEFAVELERGSIRWEEMNYDQPPGRDLARRFGVDKAVIVLARTKDGQPLEGWKRLDALWGLVGDPTGFAALVRQSLQAMLVAEPSGAGAAPSTGKPPASTAPTTTKTSEPAEDLPVP